MRIGRVAARTALAVAAVIVGVAGCAAGAPTGTLTGTLQGVGGPPPGAARPWPGTVTISGNGTSRDASVGDDGAYSVTLPTGEYTIVGHSPMFGDSLYLCQAQHPVTITAGTTASADTTCVMG